MNINFKKAAWGRNRRFFAKRIGKRGGQILALIVLATAGTLISFLLIPHHTWWGTQNTESWVDISVPESLAMVEGNSLLPISDPSAPEAKVVQKMTVIVTAYSSTPQETDDSPYITAAGTWVREGIVANNFLSFGTKIRIPEIYGDKLFIVEDRMHRKKGYYHIDVWFPSYLEAKNFGAKRTYIEVLES